MLVNMFIGRPPGNYDRLLDYVRVVTGTLFFVPSATFLEDVPTEMAAPSTSAANPNESKVEEAPKSRLSSPDGSLGIGSLNKRGRT
jgi:putative iron-dependent peroxidase